MNTPTNKLIIKTQTLLPKKKQVNIQDNFQQNTHFAKCRLQIFYISNTTVSSHRRILKEESLNKPSSISLEPLLQLHCRRATAVYSEERSEFKCTIFSIAMQLMHLSKVSAYYVQYYSDHLFQDKKNKMLYWNSEIIFQKIRGEHICLG